MSHSPHVAVTELLAIPRQHATVVDSGWSPGVWGSARSYFFWGYFGNPDLLQNCCIIIMEHIRAKKKFPPTLYPPTRESRIPLFFLVRTRSHEQISHFWICSNYGAIGDWFFVVNLSIKISPTTKKKLLGFYSPPAHTTQKSERNFPNRAKSAQEC